MMGSDRIFRVGLTIAPILVVLLSRPIPGSQAAPETPDQRLKGKFLVATSHMSDPRFRQTVLLIVEHDENGALALILNRPAGRVKLAELLEDPSLASPDGDGVAVYFGGPMELDLAFILHSPDVVLESSRIVAEGVAFSTDPEMLRLVADGRGPAQLLLASGYAGWAPGQLEEELSHASWLTVDAEAALVFAPDPSRIWKQLIDRNVVRF